MKYMLLIVNDPKAPRVPDSEMGKLMASFQKITEDLQTQGKLVHSARLRPTDRPRKAQLDRASDFALGGLGVQTPPGAPTFPTFGLAEGGLARCQ